MKMSKKVRNNLRAYLFLAPWLTSLLVLTLYPLLTTLYYSFTEFTMLKAPRWVGLENFHVMFTKDSLYWTSVGNTVYYTLLAVPLTMLVALALAMLLNQRARGIGVYRTAFYLPVLMPAVAITLLWMLLLNPRNGLVNVGLMTVGLAPVGWLGSAAWSKPALVMMAVWSGVGNMMLIFLAGLKDIPVSLLEAATIDGANNWQRFRHVTLPLLTPVILFNLIIALIAAFQIFASAYVADNGKGGPLNSILMYMLLLYRNAFRYFQMGYASAMAIVLFGVLVLITLLLIRSSSFWVHYESSKH